MTVKQLRDFLADQPDDRLVILQKDVEGNGHSPLDEADEAMYLADNTWSGDVYLTPEQLAVRINGHEDGWSDDDGAPDDAVRVVLLGPVN